MSASIIRLDDRRPPPRTVDTLVRPGVVVLVITEPTELQLTPKHARIWAERLLAHADTAEQLEAAERAGRHD